MKWVLPGRFVDELPAVLADAPPLPGEEARYAQLLAVLEAAKSDAKLKQAMTDAAKEADELLVKPVFEFRNYGLQLPHHWSTIANGAAFGTDYFTRTAVAKSNILVNIPVQAKYFVMILIAINLLFFSAGGGGVAHSAHLGGALTGYLYLKRIRLNLFSEIQYRYLKWRINRTRRKFDVYSGGRRDDVNRRVH